MHTTHVALSMPVQLLLTRHVIARVTWYHSWHAAAGCHSSVWEQRWLTNIGDLQKETCNAIKHNAELAGH